MLKSRKIGSLILVSLFAVFILAPCAGAATVQWRSPSGGWLNWDFNDHWDWGVPGEQDTVIIDRQEGEDDDPNRLSSRVAIVSDASCYSLQLGRNTHSYIWQTASKFEVGNSLEIFRRAKYHLQSGTLYVQNRTLVRGTLDCTDGATLDLGDVHISAVDAPGQGIINQDGGTASIAGTLGIASVSSQHMGRYHLKTGDLTVNTVQVGVLGDGEFIHQAGTVNAANIEVGNLAGRRGRYWVYEDAVLNVNNFTIGSSASRNGGHGYFNILSADSSINVNNGNLTINFRGHWIDEVGGTIDMYNSNFFNNSTSKLSVNMENTDFILSGSTRENAATFEAASSADGGWLNNFAINSIAVGTAEDAGHVSLRDAVENNGGDECVFVRTISIFDANSSLDLHGVDLYVEGDLSADFAAWIGDDRLYDSALSALKQLQAVYDADEDRTTFTTSYLDLTGTHWTGETGDWAGADNWNNGVPIATENAYINNSGTAQFSSGIADVKDLYAGYDREGHLEQSGGTLNAANFYIAYDADPEDEIDAGTGSFTMSGGTLNTTIMSVGANGSFSVTNSAASINISGGLSFADGAQYSAVAGTVINMLGGNFDILSTTEADMAGLENTEIIFTGGAATYTIEAASLYGGQKTGNFNIATLTIGGAAIGNVQIVNDNDNGNQLLGREALYVGTLTIADDGSFLDVNGLPLILDGDVTATLDAWIGAVNDGKLRDTTLLNGAYLESVYNEDQEWTYLKATDGTNDIICWIAPPLEVDDDGVEEDPDDMAAFSNWNYGGPSADVIAYINNGGTAGIAGGDIATKSLYVGFDGEGYVRQSGGTFTAENIYIGHAAGGDGSYSLTGGTLTVSGEIRVGVDGGIGRFEWFDGTLNASIVFGANGTLAIGYNANMYDPTGMFSGLDLAIIEITNGATVTHNTAAGTVEANYLHIGSTKGDGTFVQSAGITDIGTDILLGKDEDSAGTYKLTGGTLKVGGAIQVGSADGTGTFKWYGGHLEAPSLAIAAGNTLAMGFDFNVSDLISGALLDGGGAITGLDAATLQISDSASATHDAGTLDVDTLTLGTADGSGTYRLTGGGVLNIATEILVGTDGGAGRLELYGGTLNVTSVVMGDNSTLVVGFNADMYDPTGIRTGMANAVIEITNGASTVFNEAGFTLEAKHLHIGSADGNGTFNQSAGLTRVGYEVLIGTDAGSTGTYNLTGGALEASVGITIGSTGAGLLNLSGGTVTTGSITVGDSGTLDITNNAVVVNTGAGVTFADGGQYSAVAGTTIYFSGGNFTNQSTTEADLAGMANTTFIFDGGSAVTSLYEVAGLIGGGPGGYFGLLGMTLGGAHGVGKLQLVDNFDNGNRGAEDEECLFIGGLTIGEGSYLDANGFIMYVDGDVAAALNALIGGDNEGSLYDSTLSGLQYLLATYDAVNDWTEVQVSYIDGTNWTAGAADWFTADNWSSGLPDADTDAYINNSGTAQVAVFTATARNLYVGYDDEGTVEQTSGTMTVDNIYLGYKADSAGTFKLTAGQLNINSGGAIRVGVDSGAATFKWYGGNIDAPSLMLGSNGTLAMGFDFTAGGLVDGTIFDNECTVSGLSLVRLRITNGATVTHNDADVTLQVNSLVLGNTDGAGTYNLGEGTLTVSQLTITANGIFGITDNSALVNVASHLTIEDGGQIAAVAGAQININGADFINKSTTEADLAEMVNIEFLIQGGTPTSELTFEVASLIDGGMAANFAVGGLTITGFLKLVDDEDNGNQSGIDNEECLFLAALSIAEGYFLDINDLLLYLDGDLETMLDALIAADRLIDSAIDVGFILDAVYDVGNDWTKIEIIADPGYVGDTGGMGDDTGHIPEPATVIMLGLGLVGFAGLLRRKTR